MKCMYEYNYCKVYAYMHNFIQNDKIGMRNKGNMNECYTMCYEIFIGVWSLIRNAYDALK